jgi:hypothetical protein
MRTSLLALTAALVTAGCGLIDADEYLVTKSMTTSMQVKSVANRVVVFQVHFIGSDGCAQEARVETEQDSDGYLITPYQKLPIDEDYVCTAVIKDLSTEVSVKVDGPGVHTFRFWRNGDATLDTTFTVE